MMLYLARALVLVTLCAGVAQAVSEADIEACMHKHRQPDGTYKFEAMTPAEENKGPTYATVSEDTARQMCAGTLAF